MSTNLAFRVKGGGIVDFPIQTNTTLTRAILSEKDCLKRMKMFDENLRRNGCDLDTRLSVMERIGTLMDNPNLELIEI